MGTDNMANSKRGKKKSDKKNNTSTKSKEKD